MSLATRTPQRPLGRTSRARERFLRAIVADTPFLFAPLTDRQGTIARARPVVGSGTPDAGSYVGSVALSAEQLIVGGPEVVNLTGGYVDWGDAAPFSPTTGTAVFTVECMIRPTAVNLGAQMIMAKHQEWQLRIEGDGSLLWDVNFNGASAIIGAQTAAGAMVAGVKHHIAATYDRAAPRAILYVDGVPVVTTNALSNAFTVTDTGSPLQIGRRSDGGGNVFGGRIGFVALYGYVLPAARVAEHAAAALAGGA